MQHAGGIDDVERPRLQAGSPKIGPHEVHLRKPETPRRRRAELKRGAGQIGADDHAVRPREVQTHLPSSTPHLDDARISWNRLVDQARELASLGTRVERLQGISRWVTWKRGVLVEAAYGIGALVAVKAKVGNPVGRIEAIPAAATGTVRREHTHTCRAGPQVPERVQPLIR